MPRVWSPNRRCVRFWHLTDVPGPPSLGPVRAIADIAPVWWLGQDGSQSRSLGVSRQRLRNLPGALDEKLRHRANRPILQGHHADRPRWHGKIDRQYFNEAAVHTEP